MAVPGHGRISAWAEEPAWPTGSTTVGRAHLRVGGGAGELTSANETADGASPRGRRSLGVVVDRGLICGRISAWAEEPWPAFLLYTVDVRRISAWAEEPNGASALQGAFAAHLRVGGGAEVSTSFR